jgi:hypothetical protein
MFIASAVMFALIGITYADGSLGPHVHGVIPSQGPPQEFPPNNNDWNPGWYCLETGPYKGLCVQEQYAECWFYYVQKPDGYHVQCVNRKSSGGL